MRTSLIVAAILAAAVPFEASAAEEFTLIETDPLAGLNSTERAAVRRWLKANPLYDLITRDYCGCAYYSDTHPYVAKGDFNADGRADIAMLVGFKAGTAGPIALFVFNGPFGKGIPAVSFTDSPWDTRDALFNGGGRLFIGPTESDNGYTLVPKGKTYELEYQGNAD